MSVRDLEVGFETSDGLLQAVRGVSFDVLRGQRVGVVGESGSGKSLTALAIMGLLKPPARIAGEVILNGRDVLPLRGRAAASVRGNEVAMIYQNPLTALDPLQTVGHQIVEAIRAHTDLDRRGARERAWELLDEVGVADARRRFSSYPHEFSGGMLQRVVIAMAISGSPDVLIADEATTALDVTTQARIIELLLRVTEERNSAVIFITHDLGTAAALCDRIQVMYAGRIVERAGAIPFYELQGHPYSEALMGAVCRLDADPDVPLPAIGGQPPLVGALPPACAFHPRCPRAEPRCSSDFPPDFEREDRMVECHFAGERLARRATSRQA
jgi:peptide/nickel transport system ATP-binding protein